MNRATMNMNIHVSLSGEIESFVYMPMSFIVGAYGRFYVLSVGSLLQYC